MESFRRYARIHSHTHLSSQSLAHARNRLKLRVKYECVHDESMHVQGNPKNLLHINSSLNNVLEFSSNEIDEHTTCAAPFPRRASDELLLLVSFRMAQ